MSDTVTILIAEANVGEGRTPLATDVVDAGHLGLVKFMLGGAGVNGGFVGSDNPMPVSGTFWQATQPVSLASVPSHPVTNAGTFVTQENGAALTSLQLIDDVVFAENSAHVSGDKGFFALAVRNSGQASLTGADGRYSPIAVDDAGRVYTKTIGAGAAGSAVTGNPVLMAGSDGTNARTVRTDTSGYPLVRPYDGTNSMPMMDAAARRGFVGITDGTNTAAVKAASTAAAATDPAVVVAISPNNTVASNFTSIGGVSVSVGSGTVDSGSQRVALATNSPGVNPMVRAQTTVTRPGNTTVYAAGDCWSDSTSAPTSGGFTLSSVAKASGGGGVIMGMSIVSTNAPATVLQVEIWVADSAVTNINDNAAFSLSDSDALKIIAKVPFALSNDGVNNGQAFVSNLWIPYVCSGSANLRFLIKVLNAYTPASAEQLTVTAWGQEYDS